MDYKKIVIDAILETSEKMLKISPKQVKELGEEKTPIKAENFSIIIGITGEITGQLIFGFSDETVYGISSIMIGQETNEMDELTMSAIAEFANVLAGNATIQLVDAGSKKLGMSPPSIVMGQSMRISTKIKPINKYKIEFDEVGTISLHIALREKI